MHSISKSALHQALEKIHREKFGGGGTATQFEDEAVPDLLRRSIAVYEAARCVIGYMTPFYDEISKVIHLGLASHTHLHLALYFIYTYIHMCIGPLAVCLVCIHSWGPVYLL